MPGCHLQLRLQPACNCCLRLRCELRLQGLRLHQGLIRNASLGASRGTFQQSQEQPMKNLLNTLAKLFAWLQTPSIEERYLAQAVDAIDLQVRLHALERGRP